MKRRYAPAPRKKGPDPAARLRAATAESSAKTSSSLRPAGTPSFGLRARAGIASRRSSIERTPTVSSMAARSASVCGEYGLRVSSVASAVADMRAVVGRREQARQLAAIRDLDLEQPALGVGR